MATSGFALEVTQIIGFALAPQGFLDTNMLLSPTQNHLVGGIAKQKIKCEGFCVAVVYRLKARHIGGLMGDPYVASQF